MRRILLWAMTTVSAVVLLLGYRTSTSSALPSGEVGTPTGTRTTATAPTTAASPAAGTTASGYTGTVTGDTADTRWGPVQVQATVSRGRITAVTVLQQPDGNGKDQEINADALPTLVQETIDAQSAHIDMVSGATVTSDGYVTSLQSALDRAGIA